MSDMVSVALPVYHGAQYLEEQLNSILNQLEPGDEVVISYQDSQDGSLELIQRLQEKDGRIKLVLNDEPGITANFNLAIEHCAGDYIFLSDQDDVWLPDKRQKMLECFHRTGADLIHHNAVHTDEALHPQEKTFFEIYPIGPGKWHNIKKPRMSGCCMAFTRALRQKLLPLPEIWGYDQWIVVLAEFVGKIVYLDDVLLLHRLHGDNSTTSTRRLSVVLRCRARLLFYLVLRLIRIRVKG